jgi:glycosyltransferase involved in cell wall biosynthesis
MPGRVVHRARWKVGIVVPAHNEARLIAACLQSLVDAIGSADIDAWIIVVTDRCDDDTASIAERLLGDRGAVCSSDGSTVGAARRLGAQVLVEHFCRAGATTDRIWLLSTDADTTVPRDWVSAHLRSANAGAAAVAGTVTVASFEEHPPEVADLYHRYYTVHADGRHAHLHGANLGVRADAYLAVGGWQPLATGEDRELWGRLFAAGYPLISSIEGSVFTSGRRSGRAPDGFAAFLKGLGAAGRMPKTS